MSRVAPLVLALLASLPAGECSAALAPQLDWLQTLFPDDAGAVHSVAARDDGNFYAAGDRLASAFPPDHQAWVARFDSQGQELWSREFGGGATDDVQAAALALDGGLFAAGRTDGSLGAPAAGNLDAFLARFDAVGQRLWTTQWGTPGIDEVYEVAADPAGGALVVGSTTGDLAAAHAGNLDAFVVKVDPEGQLLWSRQFGGPEHELASAVGVDALGNAYVVGSAQSGLEDRPTFGGAYLRKYTPAGDVAWTRTYGAFGYDNPVAVDVDAAGGVHLVDWYVDVAARRYTSDGELQWSKTIDLPDFESSSDVSVDGRGSVYISGGKRAVPVPPQPTSRAALLIKLRPVPEPRGQALAACGAALLGGAAGRSRLRSPQRRPPPPARAASPA